MGNLRCFVVAFAVVLTANELHAQLVQTYNGPILGQYINNVAVFHAIPYAAPPIGHLRFMKPQEAQNWTETRLCNGGYSLCCVQATRDDIGEDCLYLNVYTPSLNISAGLPVMVFIHGGGFNEECSAEFPDEGIVSNLASRDVVFVTLNYRLDSLGFFTTRTNDFPANLALFDQAMALEWVHRNIHNFGGSPTRVTLLGESAGACSASFHTYSPVSQNLFQQVIMQSGTAFLPPIMIGASSRVLYDPSKDYAVTLGCIEPAEWDKGNFNGMKECMQNKTIQQLLDADNAITFPDPLLPLLWLPQIDGPGGFFPASLETLASSRSPSTKVMLGNCRDEKANSLIFSVIPSCESFADCTLANVNRTIVTSLANQIAAAPNYAPIQDELNNLLDFIYAGGINAISDNDSFTWADNSVKMNSDYQFLYGTRKELVAWQAVNATTYLYSFDYVTPAYPWYSFYPSVVHTNDNNFLFNMTEFYGVPWVQSAEDVSMIDLVGKLWTNFAKTGNPNLPIPLNKPTWYPASANAAYYSIQALPEMREEFHHLAWNLWNNLVPAIQAKVPKSVSTVPCPTTAALKASSVRHNCQLMLIWLFFVHFVLY